MSRTPSRPLAALTGAAAYLAGYVLVFLTSAGSIEDELDGLNLLLSLLGQGEIPTWRAVGWLFYNTMFVPLTYPRFGGGTASRNLLADATPLVYLFPVLLLGLAGAALARYENATTPGTGATAGAQLVLGFLPLVIIGVYAFTVTRGDAIVQLDPVRAAIAGVLYPAICGALGGALVGWLRGRERPVRPTA